jgi:hypothetical protein
MTAHPSAGPTGNAPDAARPLTGTTRQPGPTGPQNPASDDLPDADAAEPEPHEHLPSRSDDN